MPTQNRRVATYLPPHIDEPFKAFKSQRDTKGDSEALIAILSEYFQVSQKVAYPSSSNLLQRIEAIEKKIGSLKSELLNELKSELQPLNSKSINSLQGELPIGGDLKLIESKSELLSEPDVGQLAPMDGNALSKRFGLSRGAVSKMRRKHKGDPKHFTQWSKSKDPDGVAWEYHEDDKLYHPVQSVYPSQERDDRSGEANS